MALDSRRLPGVGIFSGVENGQPFTDRFAKRFNFEPAMDFRETIEFHETRPQQISSPQQVRAGMVMKSRGHLYQPL